MPQHSIELVAWQELSELQHRQARAIAISPQQVEYAGSVETQIQMIENESGPALVGLGIALHDEVVGLLVLKRADKAPKWASPGSAVISGMRIDTLHQGKQFGRLALLGLPHWLAAHWPECSELSLSVDEENVSGIKAYAAAGFEDLGQRVKGRIGWVRYMSKPLLARLQGAA